MTPLHIIAGLLGLTSGAVALYARKGAKVHRKSGMIFVYTMLFMSASGAVLAALKPQRMTVVAGALTFYLVTTALLAVRRPIRQVHWTDVAAMLVGLTVGIFGIALGVEASNSVTGTLDGLPAAPGFVFGSVALLATLGDLRMILARGIQGASRIARHLWRMCSALLIAALSFFLGQQQVFPEAIRKTPLLNVPIIIIAGCMIFWLFRVRFSKRFRGEGVESLAGAGRLP